MSDVFEEREDLNASRTRLYELIDETPNLDWLLLTKRPQAIKRLSDYAVNPRSNVWLGVTVEHERELAKRLPHLL